MKHEIETKYGKVIIVDSHIFEVILPESTQAVVTIAERSFLMGDMLNAARDQHHQGENAKKIDKNPILPV